EESTCLVDAPVQPGPNQRQNTQSEQAKDDANFVTPHHRSGRCLTTADHLKRRVPTPASLRPRCPRLFQVHPHVRRQSTDAHPGLDYSLPITGTLSHRIHTRTTTGPRSFGNVPHHILAREIRL